MIRSRSRDPLDRLTRTEKGQWRAAERRARNQHDTEQMAALLGLAASGRGVTGVSTLPDDSLAARKCAPVEMIINGRRLRAARVQRRSLSKLGDAISSIAAVPLTAVSRYGPYWVLTFRLATEQLVLLVDQLTLLPDWGGPGGRELAPVGPLATLGA
jgi:hypothetical protein